LKTEGFLGGFEEGGGGELLGIYEKKQKYDMSNEQFMQKIRAEMNDDNLEYVEWIGKTKILKRLKDLSPALEEVLKEIMQLTRRLNAGSFFHTKVL
jgi:hypothetical protein